MSTKPTTLDLEHLPDDPELLKALVRDLVGETDRLWNQIREFLQQRYGRKAETFTSAQMELFYKQIKDQLKDAPKVPEIPEKPKAPFVGHGRRKPNKNLPVIRTQHSLSEDGKTCLDCGGALHKIGEECRTLLDWFPASFVRREQTCEKYACSKCQGKVVTSELPPQAIERCMAGEGLLAHVIASKYGYHQPLYRQSEIAGHEGADLNRSTLNRWTARGADVLTPVYDAMIEDVLQSKVLHNDDTTVPVLDERGGPPSEPDSLERLEYEAIADDPKGRRKARDGYLWTWVGDKEHPAIVFNYTPTRAGTGPKNFLGDWKGYLVVDAYSGYDALFARGPGIKECCCWAHCRRKFKEAFTTDKVRCGEAIAFIAEIYKVETLTEDKDAVERHALRQQYSKPVLAAFKKWLDAQALVTLPKSPVGKAIGYALRQWNAFETFLQDGDIPIDNNPAENALRRVALGRKNWLFCATDEGGQRAAILYSFIATCKRHGVNPQEYFRDVLTRLAFMPSPSKAELRELMPHLWKSQTPQLLIPSQEPQVA